MKEALVSNLKSWQDQVEEDSDHLLESAILFNLFLTSEQRIEAHENALQLMLDLVAAGKLVRGESSSQSPA